MGDSSVFIFIYIVFPPFIVYLDSTGNLQSCSQVGHCQLFTSAEEKKKKKKKLCETFLNHQSASGRKPVDRVQKAKSFTPGTRRELGTARSKVNREEV